MDPSYIRDIKLWKALQTGDDSTFKSNFSPDLVAIVGDAQQNRDQFVAAFKHCRAGAISLHNHNTKTVSPDSIATSYGLHLEMTCGKQVVAKNDAITMTWDHIKGDKWLIGRITQTPIPPAP